MTAPRLLAALHAPGIGEGLVAGLVAAGLSVDISRNMATTWNRAREGGYEAILLAARSSDPASPEFASLAGLAARPGGPALFVFADDPDFLAPSAAALADFLPPRIDPAEALRRVRFGLARRDALARQAAERARLLRESHTDFKTGLFNDRFFARRLREELGRAARLGHPVSALMIDFDDFKAINDVHGHECGDRALFTFAEILREWLRGFDVAARLGGDEFGVLLPETDAQRAGIVARRLRALVQSRPVEHAGRRVALSISIGLAECRPGRAEDPEGLLRAADEALRAAKQAGRGLVRAWDGSAAADGTGDDPPSSGAEVPAELPRAEHSGSA